MIVHIQSDDDRVKSIHLADGTVLKTKVLIGCDGVNSVVSVFLGFSKPSYAGRAAVRGFVKLEDGHGFEPKFMQFFGQCVSNVMEYPNDVKFRRLRKANPTIQRNIVAYKAALEILKLISFHEEVIVVEPGKADPYFVLKRNDPGLLWLAKSTLETYFQ